MSKIVNFQTYATEKKKKDMYAELVSRLRSAPARRYTVQEAESLADEILRIYGHAGSAPTPIVRIAHEFGFATYKAKDIPANISGNMFIGGSTKKDYGADKVIIVGEDEPLPHQRFIVAHELAHYLMDYTETDRPDPAFSRPYPKVNHNSPEDIRADRFAAELLMPKRVFLTEYVKAMKISDYERAYTIPYLAKTFGTDESCVQRRIREVLE